MSQILKRLENLKPFQRTIASDPGHREPKSAGKAKFIFALAGVLVVVGVASAVVFYKDKFFPKPEPIKKELSAEEVLHIKNREAVLALKEKRKEDAVKILKDLVEKNPKRLELYINLGTAYRANGQFEEAQKLLNEALILSPSHAKALNNLALIELDLGHQAEAERNLKASLTLDPEMTEGMLNLGIFYEKNGNYQDAIEWYKKYVTHPRADRSTASLVKARVPRLNSLLQYLNRKQEK